METSDKAALKREMHLIADGHLSFASAGLAVCQPSARTIEQYLPLICDHESDEVRRMVAPVLAMLAMTLRNISYSITDPIVSLDRMRKALDDGGAMAPEDEENIDRYRERLRHEDWKRIFLVAERATMEADALCNQTARKG